jgi:hypothetical protein
MGIIQITILKQVSRFFSTISWKNNREVLLEAARAGQTTKKTLCY